MAATDSIRAVCCALGVATLVAFVVQRPDQGQLQLLGDDRYYLIQATSLLLDADMDFQNEYVAFGDPFHNAQYETTRGLGNALLWAPFLYLGLVSGVAAGERQLTALGPWLAFGCASGTLFYALAAFGLLFCDPRLRGVHPLVRAAVLAAFAFGTPVWAYALYFPLYNHVLCLFLAVLVFRLAGSSLAQRTTIALGGAAIGVMLCVRPELGVLALLFCAGHVRSWLERFVPIVLIALAIFAIELTIFSAAGKTLVSEGFLDLTHPELGALLFGPRNGFFYQQPLLLLGGAALLVYAVRNTQGRLLLVAIAAIVWVQASAWDVWGGGAIGARRLVPLVPFMAFGLLALDVRKKAMTTVAILALATGAYAAATRGIARALAVERNQRPYEHALTAWLGKLTALPWLATISLRERITLDRAYKASHYVVLYRWPSQTGRISDRLRRDSQRFRDLQVELAIEDSSQRRRFVLPLHRTPPDAVMVRVIGEGPVIAAWNGALAPPAQAAQAWHAFRLPETAGPGSASLDLVLPRAATLEELALVADVPEAR